MSQPYTEAIAMCPSVTSTPCATSSREKTGDIITFTQFEEKNIFTKNSNDSESGDESDKESIMMSKQDMDAMNSGDESDHDLISIDMLEDILDGSQTHSNVNRREARYKIRDRIIQRKSRLSRHWKKYRSIHDLLSR